MTIPLHQLPNGSWIDLTYVNQINPRLYDPPMDHTCAQVIVVGPGFWHQLHFQTLAEAQAYANELAYLVNEARQGRVVALGEGGVR